VKTRIPKPTSGHQERQAKVITRDHREGIVSKKTSKNSVRESHRNRQLPLGLTRGTKKGVLKKHKILNGVWARGTFPKSTEKVKNKMLTALGTYSMFC